MMIFRLSLLSLSLAAVNAAGHVINKSNGGIDLNSDAGRHLMVHARRVDNTQNQNADLSFLSYYAVKFQGCHHVQQWNNNADDDSDVRIKTKRLVRFRLCPSNDCSTDASGCSKGYGDYVVDMNTFVEAYLSAKVNESDNMCDQAAETCNSICNGSSDCVVQCYSDYGFSDCYGEGERKLSIDITEYAECAQFDMGNNRALSNNNYNYNNQDDGDVTYYLGPYCADQGGEIHMGVFTDDTCTTFAQNGESQFYSAMGYALPYSDNSLVSQMCLKCSSYNENGEYQLSELCTDTYQISGKCETKMNVDYPNESSCSYIEGIKIIREDGVIRTSSTKKSKAAAVSIGLFLTVAVLLAGYVYYLRTKLGRAQINLSAASQTLS
jgi:hypothetical protein